MSILDIILIVLLAGFVINGLFRGLIRLLGNVVGLIAGAYLASHFYLVVFEWSKVWSWVREHESLGKVIAFIILFIVATKLTEFLFILIEKLFKFMAVIPGSRFINNLFGAALGFLEGALFLGIIIYVVSRYLTMSEFVVRHLQDSFMVPFLMKIVRLILPILPDALKMLKSIV